MANPQRENGHIDIANELGDIFCRHRFSGQEWQILWVILRQTWGYAIMDNKGNVLKGKDGLIAKKKTDRISLSQFAKMTGIDRRNCPALLNGLVEKGLVRKTVSPNGKSVSYGLQKDYEKWSVSCKSMTPAGDMKKHVKVTCKSMLTKENVSKENVPTTTRAEVDKNLKAIVKCYESNLGMLTPMLREELVDISDSYRALWFQEAVREALANDARSLRYIVKILDRWKVDGFKAPKRMGVNGGKSRSDIRAIPGKLPTAEELKRSFGKDLERSNANLERYFAKMEGEDGLSPGT